MGDIFASTGALRRSPSPSLDRLHAWLLDEARLPSRVADRLHAQLIAEEVFSADDLELLHSTAELRGFLSKTMGIKTMTVAKIIHAVEAHSSSSVQLGRAAPGSPDTVTASLWTDRLSLAAPGCAQSLSQPLSPLSLCQRLGTITSLANIRTSSPTTPSPRPARFVHIQTSGFSTRCGTIAWCALMWSCSAMMMGLMAAREHVPQIARACNLADALWRRLPEAWRRDIDTVVAVVAEVADARGHASAYVPYMPVEPCLPSTPEMQRIYEAETESEVDDADEGLPRRLRPVQCMRMRMTEATGSDGAESDCGSLRSWAEAN